MCSLSCPALSSCLPKSQSAMAPSLSIQCGNGAITVRSIHHRQRHRAPVIAPSIFSLFLHSSSSSFLSNSSLICAIYRYRSLSRHHLSSPRQSQGYCCLFCLQFLFITSFCFTRVCSLPRRRRCRLLLLPFRLLHAHLSAEEAKKERGKGRVLFSAFFIIIQTPLVNLKRCRPSLAESSSFSTLNFAF